MLIILPAVQGAGSCPGGGLSSSAGLEHPVTPVKYMDQVLQSHQQHIYPVQGKEPRPEGILQQQAAPVQGTPQGRGMPTQFLPYSHSNIVTRTKKH